MSITVGMKGREECVVTPENTAAAVGSGLVPVFGRSEERRVGKECAG